MPEVHTAAPMTQNNSRLDSLTSNNIVFLLRRCGLPQWRVISEAKLALPARVAPASRARRGGVATIRNRPCPDRLSSSDTTVADAWHGVQRTGVRNR